MESWREDLRLPFLGRRANDEIFQYILIKLDAQSALIAIPSWLSQRIDLEEEEDVHLHLTSLASDTYAIQGSIEGKVDILASRREEYGRLYRLLFKEPLQLSAVKQKEIIDEKSALKLVKDTLFLKNGIFIYLKHLIPFFSRLLLFSGDRFEKIKDLLFKDTQDHVLANMKKLESLHKELKAELTHFKELPSLIDLEAFGEIVKSEIDSMLYQLAIEGDLPLMTKPQEKSYTMRSYKIYLHAIKVLEGRLYSNYNQMVCLYTKALK